ncbi:unnamed protein product [Rotaria sp. Silwood2]|nr:unnamed protein product [Rotaria sp. Silwood2]
MPFELVSCIWCRKNTTKHFVNTVKLWRNISSKRYQWIHKLLEQRGSELEADMVICNKCRTSLYKERKRGGVVRIDTSLSVESEESFSVNINQENNSIFDNLINIGGVYGDGNDEDYCSWCLKTETETKVLSSVERMLLLCDYKIYCSPNAKRCKSGCVEIPVERFNEPTSLTCNQISLLINDLIYEVNRVKLMPLLVENDSMISEDDYQAWTGWSLNDLKDMTSLISPRMHKSKHRQPFDAICMYWIKLKTNLSFRQIGTLFKIQTKEESIRKRVEDSFHAVSRYLHDAIIPSHLGFNHLSRADAIAHHTAYTETFFGNSLALIWDGTYIYCNKSEDHKLQRETYSGQKSRHLVKFMSIVLPDGYVLDLIGPFNGKENDAKISRPGDTQIVDRGFRDVAGAFEDLGFDVKMPGFLQKGAKQLDIEEANETRMTTKTRWIIESFHSQFKKWRFFSERISQDFLLNIDILVRTLAASLNKYRPRLFRGKSAEDYTLANKMLLMKNRTSHLEQLISNGDLSLRKNWTSLLDIELDFYFPYLTLDFLREYTCGVYQIKQSPAYAKAHLYDHDGEFEFQLSSSDDSFLRCRLHSKHSSTTLYFICIHFDYDDKDEPIKDHYCECKSGARSLGCCSHIATILWYTGYARHIAWTPSLRTDRYREKMLKC